ncbi:DNA repair protein [Microbulbifer flavimaris]|uniref:DNA repair protein n=1 Tax=Microbulbifer flavimaris TaxID=1781068 RepID=A0ABX4I1M7_9GAMM|nr:MULTISPECIES: DNA polymerase Y family protein [Microbulbifer]KUJ84153.1 DNA repair protein [Microbulbifer sp. ZGT114]PCO06226.1 DNA repair protein [Microbulbifer flavimaris]
MLWLCIQFPSLPLQALTRAQPRADDDRPLAVAEQQSIVDANPVATQRGIECGLTIATACALSADLELLPRDNEREAQLLEELAQWGYSFTPVVSPQAAGPMDKGESRPACLYLELSGCLRASGGLQPLLQQLQRELKQMRISALMGLGHSPSAAHMLSQLPEHRQWLREAKSPPSAQQWRQWISFSPSKLLDCDHKTIAKLYACGIKRVSQLLAIPLSEVGSRFGRDFVNYLARLNGTRHDPVPSYQPPPQFHSELFFPSPLDNSEQLLFPAGRLVRELCQQLQRRQLYAQQLRWKLDFGQRGCKVVSVEISRPQLDPQRLIALTKLQLERFQLEQEVQALHLTCGQLLPLAEDALDEDLFGGNSHLKCSHQLLDKLKARLGHEAMSGVTLRESHLPEQAWQSADTLVLHSGRRQSGHQLKPVNAPRPSWLLSRPDPIKARDNKLFYRGEIQLLQGPERIDGYWWQHHRHARDYYIARGEEGSLYWVYQDLTSDEWYLQGIYA